MHDPLSLVKGWMTNHSYDVTSVESTCKLFCSIIYRNGTADFCSEYPKHNEQTEFVHYVTSSKMKNMWYSLAHDIKNNEVNTHYSWTMIATILEPSV